MITKYGYAISLLPGGKAIYCCCCCCCCCCGEIFAHCQTKTLRARPIVRSFYHLVCAFSEDLDPDVSPQWSSAISKRS